ncbi:MAG: M56 family metallopeptidase [Bacteroidia bacterium]|jgi:TonB family protein|nr:M56 family metallopeptidase [Bacteroidia bacterium]
MLYLLKSTLAFSLLYVLYALLLKRYTFFQFNRIYLLGIAVFSVVFPFLHWKTHTAVLPVAVLDTFTTGAATLAQQSESGSLNGLLMLYAAGVLVCVLLLLTRLYRLFAIIRHSSGPGADGAFALSGTHAGEAFSFLGRVYVGVNIDAVSKPAVLAHERVHVKQWHTLDVLFYELLHCVWWFNPLYRLALRQLRIQHEFIADDKACGGNRVHYSEVLLARAMGVAPSALVHSMFHSSFLKRRLLMLRQLPTRRTVRPVYLLALPLAGAMLLFNSFITDPPAPPAPPAAPNAALPPAPPDVPAPPMVPGVPAAPEAPPTDNLVQAEFPGGTQAMMDYLAKAIEYPAEARTQKIEGKVFIEFTVTETGAITGATVKKGAHTLLDAEALRVVSAMPAWKPATKDGKAVKSTMVLPIKFKL